VQFAVLFSAGGQGLFGLSLKNAYYLHRKRLTRSSKAGKKKFLEQILLSDLKIEYF